MHDGYCEQCGHWYEAFAWFQDVCPDCYRQNQNSEKVEQTVVRTFSLTATEAVTRPAPEGGEE